MNGEGRTQRGGHASVNDFGDGHDDKEVRVACLGSDSEDSFVTALEGLEERNCLALDYTTPLEGQKKPDWIGSWGMHMEAVAEEIACIEINMFGNVGTATCIEHPKRPTHTASQAKPSNVLHFGSDQRGIANYMMSVDAAEEEELTMEKSISRIARPADCTRPPKRPTQIASHARPSFP